MLQISRGRCGQLGQLAQDPIAVAAPLHLVTPATTQRVTTRPHRPTTRVTTTTPVTTAIPRKTTTARRLTTTSARRPTTTSVAYQVAVRANNYRNVKGTYAHPSLQMYAVWNYTDIHLGTYYRCGSRWVAGCGFHSYTNRDILVHSVFLPMLLR